MRSIRRLDGYRPTPLVLKSLHFSKYVDTDAYNFPPESIFTEDFSESEYCEDSTISREWTLTPTSTSELEDNEIHTTIQNDASELGDEAELEDGVVRCKSQQWTEYSKSENFEVCITPPQQSVLDMGDETLSPDPRPISLLHQSQPECEDGLKDDEPVEANIHESQPFSLLHQSHLESEDDLKDDGPLEANTPESLKFSPLHQYYQEFDDDLKGDEPREANSHEPPPLSPLNQFRPESDEPLEVESPEPRQLLPAHKFYPEFDDYSKYQYENDSLRADSPQLRHLLPTHQFHPEFDHYHKYQQEVESLEADIPELRYPLPAYQFNPKFDQYHEYQQEVESLEADSPEPRHLQAHQLYSKFDDYRKYQHYYDSFETDSPETLYDPQPTPQIEILCPKPIREYPTHRVILKPELFEDWFVDMIEPIFIDEGASSPCQSISETPSPEPQNLVPVRSDVLHPEFDDEESDKADRPKHRRLYLVNQIQAILYDSRPVLELDHEGVESLEILSLHH